MWPASGPPKSWLASILFWMLSLSSSRASSNCACDQLSGIRSGRSPCSLPVPSAGGPPYAPFSHHLSHLHQLGVPHPNLLGWESVNRPTSNPGPYSHPLAIVTCPLRLDLDQRVAHPSLTNLTHHRSGCPILAQHRGPQGQVLVLGVVQACDPLLLAPCSVEGRIHKPPGAQAPSAPPQVAAENYPHPAHTQSRASSYQPPKGNPEPGAPSKKQKVCETVKSLYST